MLQRGHGYGRPAAVAAVAAACLAAAACSSSSNASSAGAGSVGSTGGASSAASGTDPLASLSADKIEQEATANAVAAATLTINGTISQSGQTYTIDDLFIKHGVGCEGTIGEGSEGSFALIIIGSTVYLNPDKQFWESNAGSGASAAIALVDGRYLKTTTTDKTMTGIGDLCDTSQLLSPSGSTYTKGAVTTVGGVRLQTIKVSDGSTDYITDTSKPEFTQATSPKGAKDGSGKITIAIDAPGTIAAPPATQVIDGSQLGF
jgi:hypothetical protein